MTLKNQILALVFMILAAPFAQASNCSFESSERSASRSYFGFYLYDGNRKVDERWFYSEKIGVGYEQACLQSVEELQKFEANGHCRPIWSSVKTNVMHEFNSIYTRTQVAGCLKRIEALEKGQQATAADDRIIDLRQKLIPYLGISALALMSDKTVLAVAQEKGLK